MFFSVKFGISIAYLWRGPMADDKIRYTFSFVDGKQWSTDIALAVVPSDVGQAPPAWTRLEFHQCGHCPLSADEVAHCPYAVSLVEPARVTANRPSHEPVTVTVMARSREIRADTTLQRAMGSLLGLVGPFSGCPVTAILRPMARYHLPLSSPDETLSRTFGTYLLGQYLRAQYGKTADWSMRGLQAIYADLRLLNLGMSQRLRGSQEEDAGVNSFVLLDLLAADVGYALEQYEGDLDEAFREFL